MSVYPRMRVHIHGGASTSDHPTSPRTHLALDDADVVAKANAGRVDENDGKAAKVGVHREDVARRAWARSHNGALLAAKVVEEATLAHVRRTGEHDPHTAAQPLARAPVCQMRAHGLPQLLDLGSGAGCAERAADEREGARNRARPTLVRAFCSTSASMPSSSPKSRKASTCATMWISSLRHALYIAPDAPAVRATWER